MKKKVPFDIKYRQGVENGLVKVVTRDDREMKVVWFDVKYHGQEKMVVAQNETDCILADETGHVCMNGEQDPDDLFLLVECWEPIRPNAGMFVNFDLDVEIGHWFDKLDDKYCQLVDYYKQSDIRETAKYFFHLGELAQQAKDNG